MIDQNSIRTDLALESQESLKKVGGDIPGVKIQKKNNPLCRVQTTIVKIVSQEGERNLKKPKGTYITMEIPDPDPEDEVMYPEVTRELCRYLLRFLKKYKPAAVLVVGLGNRDITPDALGPRVVRQLHVSRHIAIHYGKHMVPKGGSCVLSGIAPGAMGQTGMETLEIIQGIVQKTEPDLIMAVDALAARSLKRLNSTIQITDTGICPGSGVFNDRKGLNKETLGVPVIGIGIPTVVDAATIAAEAWGEESTEGFGRLREMFVTPKDVDETLKILSDTVAQSVNMAVEEFAV